MSGLQLRRKSDEASCTIAWLSSCQLGVYFARQKQNQHQKQATKNLRCADHVGRCQIRVATFCALGESSYFNSVCLDKTDESNVRSCKVIGNISLSLLPFVRVERRSWLLSDDTSKIKRFQYPLSDVPNQER